jgi:predicted nucleic acid-binding protein
MTGNIVLDTNILIYLSKRQLNIDQIFVENSTYFISVITKIELLGYHFKDKNEFELANALINSLKLIPLSNKIVETTINLRRQHKIKIPDAIIYASALALNAKLYTNNTEDFSMLREDVGLVNPVK